MKFYNESGLVSKEEMEQFLIMARRETAYIPKVNHAQAARDKFDPKPRSSKQFAKLRPKYK